MCRKPLVVGVVSLRMGFVFEAYIFWFLGGKCGLCPLCVGGGAGGAALIGCHRRPFGSDTAGAMLCEE